MAGAMTMTPAQWLGALADAWDAGRQSEPDAHNPYRTSDPKVTE